MGVNVFVVGFGVVGVDSIKYFIEQGVILCILCWKCFVQGDEDLWNVNVKKFIELIGVVVCIDSEGWEDVCLKLVVVVNVGSGLDIVLGWFDDL